MRKYLVKIAIPSCKNRWEASVVKRTVKAENFNGMLMKAITPDELQVGARIFEVKEFAAMVKSFYFPLTIYRYPSFGFDSEELDSTSAVYLLPFIERAFAEYQCGDTDMAQYFDEYYSETAPKKIKSIEWKIKEKDGSLYGCVDVSLIEELTPEETQCLKKWIRGQNSDGVGEDFEQHDIRVGDRRFSVSFWNPSDNYCIYDEEEFEDFLR